MAQLLEDLIVEILVWLPVKSLKRFRCLSKSLCAVIDSPNFINWHLNRSSQNFNLRKMIFPDRPRREFHVCDVNVDFEEEDEILPLVVQQVSTLWRDWNVCGNCNGLLLLYRTRSYPFRFALWNPSTRQYRDLPDCPFEPPADVLYYTLDGTGLGYDDSIDDYKAVSRVYVSGDTGVEVQVWIYGLKSNTWRRAQNFPYINETSRGIGYFSFSKDEVLHGIGYFADGSLHWVRPVFRSGVQREEIVAFDMRKETFSLLPQPAIYLVSPPKLHVLEGSLCVSNFFSLPPARVDLFIRKKYGAEKLSWTKVFSLKMSVPSIIDRLYNLNVLGYSKRGDKILIDVVGKANMVAYDLNEKSFRKVLIDKDASWDTPFLCLESLVSVASGA